MSGSDRKPLVRGDRRRQADRRSGADRRAASERRAAAARAAEAERRTGQERRQGERRREGRGSDAAWAPVSLDATRDVGFSPEPGLVAAAIEARERALAHFSHFKVGAALETAEGLIVKGCNIENASYGLTVCAERVALLKALSDGQRLFTRIAVVADAPEPTPPCGPCRQLLWEYCGDIEVILANLERITGRYRLSALLPLPFDRRLLE